jgi:CDGSH-type Zn-finger protein
MSEVTITYNPNGSLLVEGPCEIMDKFGRPLKTKGKADSHVFCGCGHSCNKPFCDGSHNRHKPESKDED